MSVGSFGKTTFKVSRKKVYSFGNMKRTRTAEWKEHERYNNKPLSEFTGTGLESITLDIFLDASLGVNPRKEIERWGKYLENGYHDILVIGGKQVGKYDWKIESISEEWKSLLKKGELLIANLTINLSEYVTEGQKKKKSTDSSKTKKSVTNNKKTSINSLVVGGTYKVVTQLTGYYTSMEAKNLKATNRTGKVYPGMYYIFNLANGMVNVTKVKGSPGSWINPNKNK